MNRLRIAIIAPSDSVCMINWALELQKHNHKIIYLSIEQPSKPIEVPFKKISVRFERLYIKFWLSKRNVFNMLRQFNPDVVHSFYSTNYGVLAARQSGYPIVCTLAGSDLLIEPERNPIFKWANKFVLKHSNILNPVSNQLSDILINDYKEMREKIRIFPAGVDRELFCPKQDLNLLPIRIISTRNFKRVYNHDLFVDCIPNLLERNKNIEIIFLGEGPLLYVYQNKLERFSQVRFLGWQPKNVLASELKKSHIYVSTSFSDGTSASLLEAMACGVFPIVTDLTANQDWIKNEENGFLVPTGDSNYLLKKIEEAIQNRNLRKEASKRNQTIIEEKADIKKIVNRLEQIYSSLAKK